MKLSQKITLMSIAVLGLGIAQPLATFADTLNSAIQTASAIDDVTSSDNVIVQDAKVNQPVSTEGGELNVTLPTDSDQPVQLDNMQNNAKISVDLPDEFNSRGIDAGNTVVYQGGNSSLELQETSDGFRALISVTNSDSPHSYSFNLNLPEGYSLVDVSTDEGVSAGTGDILVLDAQGNISNTIAAPWAKDSNGNDVATHYEIDRTTLTQVIDFDSAHFVPFVADPAMSVGGQVAFKSPNGSWVIVPKTKIAKINTKAPNLEFISNVGPGVLYYDKTNHRYVYNKTQDNFSYTAQVVVNGWAGTAGNAGAYMQSK